MTQYYFQVIDKEMLLDLPKNTESLNNKLLKFLKNIEMKFLKNIEMKIFIKVKIEKIDTKVFEKYKN